MVQALLMGLLALLNGIQGPYHWYFFREPVMAGFWVGLIYGDPVQGTIIGATINVSYMGWISAGGANASDLYWAGLLGTFVAIRAVCPLIHPLRLLFLSVCWETMCMSLI